MNLLMIMRLIFKNVPVNVAQNVLLLLLRKKKLCSYPQQQAGPGLISYLRLNSQSDAQSTRLHPTFGKKKFLKKKSNPMFSSLTCQET